MAKKYPEVAYITDESSKLEQLEEVLGMVNDVLEAEGSNLYFSIIPSQTKSTIVSWHKE